MAHLTCVGHTAEQLDRPARRVPRRRHRQHPGPRRRPARRRARRVRHGRLRARRRAGRADPRATAASPSAWPPTPRATPARPTSTPTAGTWPPSSRPPTSPSPSSSSSAEPYLAMVDDLAALGCTKPVIPGIMPVTNAGQVARFAQLAGAEFPRHLAERFEAVADDAEAVRRLGVQLATELCERAAGRGRARPALLHVEPVDRDPRDRHQPRPRPPGLSRAARSRRRRARSTGSGLLGQRELGGAGGVAQGDGLAVALPGGDLARGR